MEAVDAFRWKERDASRAEHLGGTPGDLPFGHVSQLEPDRFAVAHGSLNMLRSMLPELSGS